MSHLSKKFLNWYDTFSRTLPWRQTKDPYKIWISEVMLQQTTVQAVIPYYNRWLKTFPNIYSLSSASSEKVLKIWQGLGYYSRARNLHKTAQIIVKTMGGSIPDNKKDLLGLPGLGEYTASAILSIAFSQKEPVIETNIRRIILRLLCKKTYADSKQDPTIRAYLKTHLPQERVGCFNQALMDFGSMICRPKEPHCLLCFLQKDCQAFQKGQVSEIPMVKKKQFLPIDVCIALIHQKNHFYIRKRPQNGLFGGMWEFPGGKQESDESLEQTLHREIKEELGIKIVIKKKLKVIKHTYTQFKVKIHPFFCKNEENLPQTSHSLWATLSEISQYPMPMGNVKILKQLKETSLS